ncbi:MAG: hypothetical protein IE887_04035, partial [Campylobacterales bacterium]|nr:hypothetical protein [Campylobacterales bacterium]
MFTKPLNHIITKESLKTAYDSINTKSPGIDDVSFREFEKDFTKNLETLVQRVVDGLFAPEPLKKIEIEKENSDEKRPLALSAIKDKLVQKVLYENLN